VKRWIVLLLLGMGLSGTAASDTDIEARKRWVAAHPVLKIAIDPQQGAEVSGGGAYPLVTQYLGLLTRHTGVRFEVVRTRSWEDSVRAFVEHRVDLLPSTSDRLLTADLGDRGMLSAPFYVGHTLIVTRTVGPARITMRDLDGRTVAFKGGGAYESWLRREHPLVTRLPLNDIHQVLAAVESGIADAAVGMDVAYHPIVRRDYALSLRVVGDVPDMPVTVRVAVQRDDGELLGFLDDGLRRVTADENEAVIERWLETAYLRAPTLSQVASVYRIEIALGVALLLALVFAMWQMRRAQLASRRGEQQKTLLLAVMSHEVRNAVNAVVSSIDLMSRQPLDGPQRDLMAIAQSSSRNLRTLLKSALDYTHSEVRGFTPDLVSCDALGVARQVIESQRPAIEAKGLDVRLDLPMGPLPWLLLDETRLRQLLENFLTNAVKYTNEGHVGIALWQGAEIASDGVRHLAVEVFDTGVGVAPERQRGLFTAFSPSHDAHDRRLGGTGLGLSICHDIVTHLGGRLDFSSEVGVGTAVRIELPTSLVPANIVAEATGDVAPPDATAGTVLLVEDHPANRQIIAAQLKFLGYATQSVDHGQAAIDVFEPGLFVGVLLDCELPDMQGYDIAAELRAREVAAGVPGTRFIAISANHGEAHVHRCEESGIDTVLGKPLSLEGLRTALAAPPTPRPVESAFVAACRADLAAIRMALLAGDLIAVTHASHRLRGGALVWGAEAIVEAMERVEWALALDTPALREAEGWLDDIATRLDAWPKDDDTL
jgi:signal transduction histidine kinase/HPt (histidine-containing phosphotransfer) domain-containing protein